MAEDLKAATPDTSFPSGAFLFGADSQSATSPSVYAQSTVWNYWKTLANTWSANGALSAPASAFTGTWITGGSATTTKPQVLIEPAGATSTGWSTSGTGFGVNAASGFVGNLLDLQLNGSARAAINYNGRVYAGTGDGTGGFSGIGEATAIIFRAGGIEIYNSASRIGYISSSTFSLGSAYSLSWGSGIDPTGTRDTFMFRDAANTVALRNGTNAQTQNWYDTYASSTDYHRVAIKTARATLASVSGATVTATGIIPDGAVVVGVTTKVTVSLGTGGGTTGYNVGDGSDADRWGAITGTAAGTSSDNTNWTAGTIQAFTSASDIVITAVGGNFNGTGTIYVSVQYLIGQCD